jgi:hypothetical protein
VRQTDDEQGKASVGKTLGVTDMNAIIRIQNFKEHIDGQKEGAAAAGNPGHPDTGHGGNPHPQADERPQDEIGRAHV